MLYALCPMPKPLDRGRHFCYKTPGSAKLTGGAPGLQIRCGAVKAVPGGFDSHALPPPVSNKTPVSIPGVFYLQNSRSITYFYPLYPVHKMGKFTHFVYGMFWVIFQWDDARVGEHRE